MSEVRAIETSYKGYRFRSRLEARWAMFFDSVGISWSYEADPISVNGEAYLPDFILSVDGERIFHEVKAEYEQDRIKPLKVYLAGKMDENDWRDRSPDTRVRVDQWLSGKRGHWFGDTYFRDCGPFMANFQHCGGVHLASSDEGCDDDSFRKDILSACESSIRSADIFCAHISTMDCFGTLVEIGFARALGKPICVTADRSVAPASDEQTPDHHGWSGAAGRELWFPCAAAAEYTSVANAAQAREFHGKFIANRTAKEFRKIAGIGKAGFGVILTFGDPASYSAIYWRNGKKLIPIFEANRQSALAVRAHRFDRR